LALFFLRARRLRPVLPMSLLRRRCVRSILPEWEGVAHRTCREDHHVKGFREFILRGNVVDLAVAVVIGAAFGAVVTSLVEDLLTPLIAAVGGQPDFSDIAFRVNRSRFAVGEFVNALVSFLVIAGAVYFLVVVPVNRLMSRFKTEPEPTEAVRECPECLSKVPHAARRCAYCTSELAAAT
jgi:large conductance mechanosensitive channel